MLYQKTLANMDETEETGQEVVELPIPPEKPEKKPKKGVMTDTKLKNLKKARAARKKNLDAKKYSQDKRGPAEVRIEEEVNRRAEELAEKKALELIEKRKQEAELAEY